VTVWPRLRDLGTTPTPLSLDTLLRPWIRHLAIIISAWWLRTSSKFSGKQSKETTRKLENGQLLSGCGFVQNIAPPSLSCDRRIKMEQTKQQTFSIAKPLKLSILVAWSSVFGQIVVFKQIMTKSTSKIVESFQWRHHYYVTEKRHQKYVTFFPILGPQSKFLATPVSYHLTWKVLYL